MTLTEDPMSDAVAWLDDKEAEALRFLEALVNHG